MNCQYQSRKMTGLFNLMFCVWCWSPSEGRAQPPTYLPTWKSFSSPAVWLSHVTPWRSYLCTQTHQRSPLKLNSRIEEIFVRKSQIVGTRMFLVSGGFGALSGKGSSESLPACHPFTHFTWWASRGRGSKFLHHLDHSGAGSLWPSAPRMLASGSTALRLYRLLITGLGAAEARWGWGVWVSWERGKLEPFLSTPLNQM